jgi:hypothetical protein
MVRNWRLRVRRAELRARQAEHKYDRMCFVAAYALSRLSDEELLEMRAALAEEVSGDGRGSASRV